MAGRNFTLVLCTFIVFIWATSSIAVNGSSECDQQLVEYKKKFREYQIRTLKALRDISDGDQLCTPSTRLENQLKTERVVHLRQKKDLITAMVNLLTDRKQKAVVLHSEVQGKMNGSLEFSCQSGNQPLSLCVWERNDNQHIKIIIADQQVIQNGGATSVDGIYTTTNGLEDGKCVLQIRKLKKDDFGSWSCTLVTNSWRVYGGIVTVHENDPPSIYFATEKGVKRYSMDTGDVERVADSSETIVGVAIDWLRNKVYYSSEYKVFRANRNGTGVETLLHTREYGGLHGLALDWVTGNIYVTTTGGFVLACDGKPTAPFTCAAVITGQGVLQGIALDPVAGTMYWTKWLSPSRGSIWRSELDGANPLTLVTRLKDPRGIAIDFSSQRLYWADRGADKIQSSDLQGRHVHTVFRWWDDGETRPYGVAVVGNRIFWSTFGSYKLQSINKSGGQIITHYNSRTDSLLLLAVMPSIDLPRYRTNHCKGHNCHKVCVLTATSSHCLE